RLICNNFDKNDIHVTLSYDKHNRPSLLEARKQIVNFFRRVNTARKRENKNKIKYIYVTETGMSGSNPHHHVILENMSYEELERIWKAGGDRNYISSSSKLRFDDEGIKGLALYLTKEKRKPGARRWNASRNLKKPHQPPPKIIKRLNIYRP